MTGSRSSIAWAPQQWVLKSFARNSHKNFENFTTNSRENGGGGVRQCSAPQKNRILYEKKSEFSKKTSFLGVSECARDDGGVLLLFEKYF